MDKNRTWHRDDATGQYVHDATVTVNAPVDTCFQYWATLVNLPRIMRYITEVRITSPNTSHWEATMLGQHVTWEARTVISHPNEAIAWESYQGLKNAGSVRFIPLEQGCQVVVHLMYDPPYGVLGDIAAVNGLNDRFHDDLVEDLTNFKKAVETDTLGGMRAA